MKILKENGKYLGEQIKFNDTIAIILLIIGLVTLIFFYMGVIFIGISVYFFIRSSQYRKGQSGETLTRENLNRLSNNHQLINDVMLPESYGNIDHILLGPNGIFVIETKNLEGEIRCDEDLWYQYKPGWKIPEEYEIKSPSKQVKRNAVKLKQFIEKKLNKKIWIEGVVVFTNPDVNLELNNPTTSILRVNELCNYITSKKSKTQFSLKELELIGKTILELKNT